MTEERPPRRYLQRNRKPPPPKPPKEKPEESKPLSPALLALREKPAPSSIDSIDLLPSWVKHAIARMELDDLSVQKAAKSVNRAEITLAGYLKSPAAALWTEMMREQARDPQLFARATLTSLTMNVTLDYLWAHEAAKTAENHVEVRKSAQWLLERPELLGAMQKEAPANITIHIGAGGSIEPITISSSHEEVKEADFELEEDNDRTT